MNTQVDFQFRLLEYSAVEPEKSTAAWSQYLRDVYLSQGWVILSTEVVRAEANSVFLGISLVRYGEPEVKASKK